MLIDTGADVTLIPEFVAERFDIDLTKVSTYETESFDGTIGQSYVLEGKISFLGKNFRGEFLTINQDYGIIGRNVLNQLMLLFDGKNLIWSEVKPK